jgi:FMN-dependent oxidoreductase (nitrilotriacetate monooxygenase family)
MTDSRFHLGWFLGMGFGPYGWNQQFAGLEGESYLRPKFYIDLAQSLERAGFDYLMFEDSSFVPDQGGSSESFLKLPLGTPKLDPAVIMGILTQFTRNLGVVATLSTTEYPPFLLARLVATIDHVSEGRAGWNIVTSSNPRSAQNHGQDRLPEHDQRYAMADEYVRLVKQLWHSWEPDAIKVDRVAGVFADHTKVAPIDFEGTWYRSRGPLNSPRSPQGQPVLVQAGGSPAGRDFAARHAEAIVTHTYGIDQMTEYRQDIHQRMVGFGRKPTEAKVLYLVCPIIGETTEEAFAKKARLDANPDILTFNIAASSKSAAVDFTQFDLDQPPPADLRTDGHQSGLAQFLARPGRTLREKLSVNVFQTTCIDLVGTPEDVAEQMGQVIADTGGDGFLIHNHRLDRRYISEIADGLVPALQRRGLARTEYAYDHFRDNLLEF